MKTKKLMGILFGGLVTILTPFSAAQANSILSTYSGSAIFNNVSVGYDSSTALSKAAQKADKWLKNLDIAQSTGSYALTYLNDGAQEYTQDSLVFTAVPQAGLSSGLSYRSIGTVSEPDPLILVGLVLIVFGFTLRKKG